MKLLLLIISSCLILSCGKSKKKVIEPNVSGTSNAQTNNKIMTKEEFWKINSNLPLKDPVPVLRKRLEKLSPESIAEYQKHFEYYVSSAETWDLWAAAYILDGGCSDDGFTDFRYGLISLGQERYEAALKNPETLIDFGDTMLRNELFGYVAGKVYEAKTGHDIPETYSGYFQNDMGEEWDFDDEVECEKRFPKLWKRWGE